MAIQIRGSRILRQRVVAAFGELCPCFVYTVAGDGRVAARARAPRDDFCDCYCRHRAGCNLLSDLIADPNTVVIRTTGRGSRYDTNTRELRWNGTARTRVPTTAGRRGTPPSLVLGHELVHAQHHNSGTLANGTTGGLSNEEINTVRGENQLRAEREPPEPQRLGHSGLQVPNPGLPDLDATDRQGCGCGFFARILRAVRRIVRRLFLALRRAFGGGRRDEREEERDEREEERE
jgi:hypothetical protein